MSPLILRDGHDLMYVETDLEEGETLRDYARRRPESNRRPSLCRRVRNHSATAPWPRVVYAAGLLLMILAVLLPGQADAQTHEQATQGWSFDRWAEVAQRQVKRRYRARVLAASCVWNDLDPSVARCRIRFNTRRRGCYVTMVGHPPAPITRPRCRPKRYRLLDCRAMRRHPVCQFVSYRATLPTAQ